MNGRSLQQKTRKSTTTGNSSRAEREKRRKRAKTVLALITAALITAAAALAAVIFCLVCRLSSGFSKGNARPTDTAYVTEPVAPEKPYGEGFLIDIRNYSEYISPSGELSDAFLTVVSEKRPYDAKKSRIPSETASVQGRRGDVTLIIYAAKAYEAMMLEMKAVGINTVNPQTKLDLAAVAGLSDADKTDEHCLGLTVDMHNCNSADVSFKNTEAYAWLSENCWRFGFIIRYPEGKSSVTGVQFRPWQFRYVGRYHARIMSENGLCLEEYTGLAR